MVGINQSDYMAKKKTNRAGTSRGLGIQRAASGQSRTPSAELRSETINFFPRLGG